MRRPWEDWEVERIRDIPRGEIPRVARELRRSFQSVTSKRHRLGIGPPKRTWSPDEDAILDSVVAAGGRIEDAAGSMGRSRDSAYKRRRTRRATGDDLPRATYGARTHLMA